MNLSNRSEQLIGKLYQGRKHMELTIGALKDGHIEVCHWGPDREEKGTSISWHDSAAGAYSAFIGLNREKKTAVSIAVNYGLLDTKELAFSILNEL